ncbi:MAG: hypothetical protein BMS9Abin05_0313 [Rhodothermia bacterium]|nr:MAG: hypothetical protein BMS9Abin05_0313 [Rhodothermia bacterium]
MSGESQRKVDFERLNLVGKAIFITGTTFRVLGTVMDSVVETLTGIAREAEQAFKSGLDANVDDATILEERSKEE